MNKQAKQIIAALLAVNLLLIGYIASHSHGDELPPLPEEIHQLSEDSHIIVKEVMLNVKVENKTLLDGINEQRHIMVQIMSTDNFDETAYDSAAQKIVRLRQQQIQNFVDAIKDMSKQFSVEERVILATVVNRPAQNITSSLYRTLEKQPE